MSLTAQELSRDYDWLPCDAGNYPTLKAALFVGADRFLRLALSAYYAAVKDMRPPDGEQWLTDDWPYSTAQDFFEGLEHHLGERLRQVAIETGHRVPSGCRGGAPAIKGHGCPAFAPAVGPAPMPSQVADITTPADPLFCGQQMQELPDDLDAATVTQQRGIRQC